MTPTNVEGELSDENGYRYVAISVHSHCPFTDAFREGY
jgi:hypothetical protein